MKQIVKPLERRAFGRRESCIEAVAKIGGRRIPCVMRNFSLDGALIEIETEIAVPATFRLAIEAKDADAVCEVRHRSGRTFGVRFLGGTIGAILEREHQAAPAGAGAIAPLEKPVRPQSVPLSGADLRRRLLGQQPAKVE